jgi:L-ornithine Nalpha-acyltransferase
MLSRIRTGYNEPAWGFAERLEICMAQARGLRFGFRIGGHRWGFPRRRIRFGQRAVPASPTATESQAALVDVLEPQPLVRRPHKWPVLAVSGALEVRIAASEAEIEAAQRLRYRVFYEEMAAVPSPQMRSERRDFDKYDEFCDHLLVIDRNMLDEAGEPAVVGTYRLLRGEVAALNGGFYTSSEYDLSPLLKTYAPETRFLELGRSCVLKSHRTRASTMQLLWRGNQLYIERFGIEVMFGCASFAGTDPEALALPLSYLHHFHRAPEGHRIRARPELYVEMDRLPKDAIDLKDALRSLPTLIKGYIRIGGFIGDGAVIDRQFGTTDVLIYFPVSRLDERWRSKFDRIGV